MYFLRKNPGRGLTAGALAAGLLLASSAAFASPQFGSVQATGAAPSNGTNYAQVSYNQTHNTTSGSQSNSTPNTGVWASHWIFSK